MGQVMIAIARMAFADGSDDGGKPLLTAVAVEAIVGLLSLGPQKPPSGAPLWPCMPVWVRQRHVT